MCNNNIKIKSRADISAYAEQVKQLVDKEARNSAERIIANNEREEN